VGLEWSPALTSTTPSGRVFLGEFGNDEVTLALVCLPPHQWISLAVDVYVIRSWDGNQATRGGPVGPDIWRLKEMDGPAEWRTNFTNWDDFRQAYPGVYPGGDYAAHTGARERDTLGYRLAGEPMDAVYRLEGTIPHTGPSLAVSFAALGLQALADESWGLDNVQVSVAPPFWLYLPAVLGRPGTPVPPPTATLNPTHTPTASRTAMPSGTPTSTASRSATTSPIPTGTATPTLTPAPSVTRTATGTPSASSTATRTPTFSATPTPAPTSVVPATATGTRTPTPPPTYTNCPPFETLPEANLACHATRIAEQTLTASP
jgi:hypothetical protein